MTDLDFFLHCEWLPTYRQTGRTTALVEACLKIDGVYLTYCEDEKRRLKRKYPNLDVRVCRATYLVGNTKPMIFDHYAIMMLLDDERKAKIRYVKEIDELKAEIKRLKKKG